ncbi:hypothetical protein AHAS_Ahas10G0076600 [Arachis hypogaea]
MGSAVVEKVVKCTDTGGPRVNTPEHHEIGTVNTQGRGDPAADQRVTTTQGRGDAATKQASDTTQGRGAAGVTEFQCSFISVGRAAGAGMQGTSSPPNRNLLVHKLDPSQSWNPRVENYSRATGFYHVSRIGMIRGFHPLLAALVERWRPETHTFVLPVGEVTVTLEDIAHIFGLPIDGEPVSGWTDSSSDFVQSQSMAIFGRQPMLSRNSKSYIKLGWVRSIRDEEPLDTEESIMRYVRCQIFCLLGSTLFTNKSTAYAHAKYLPLLRDFERIHTYSWGSACLAHLYRALCRASRYDTKEMYGPLNLLFVWAWERMPCIAPIPRHILPPAEIPVAMRWSHSERSAAWLEKTVETFRHDIDYMQEFDWRPYEGMIVPGELHVHLNLYDWTVLHGGWIEEWGNRRNARLQDLHPLPTWDFIPTLEYRDWYMRSYGHMLRLTAYVPQPAALQPPAPQVPPQFAVFEPAPYYVPQPPQPPQPQDRSASSHHSHHSHHNHHSQHSQHSYHSQHSQPMLMIPVSHDWFDFSIGGHGDQQLQNWANASLGGWSDFSAMHSPSASVDPRGASVEAGGSALPAEAGGSAPGDEAGGSAAAGMGDAAPGHPYDLRTERNPPDRYTPSKPGLSMMGKALNWMGRKK